MSSIGTNNSERQCEKERERESEEEKEEDKSCMEVSHSLVLIFVRSDIDTRFNS
jgi:hypothetical protein